MKEKRVHVLCEFNNFLTVVSRLQ